MISLRSRLFSANKLEAKIVTVPTIEVGDDRFPVVEAMFSDHILQPYIHDCLVTVHRRGRKHQFRIFCKNHKLMKKNSSIPGNEGWKGDILVMRGGLKSYGVNLRSKDSSLINYIVKRWVLILGIQERMLTSLTSSSFIHRVQQTRPFRLPKRISIP